MQWIEPLLKGGGGTISGVGELPRYGSGVSQLYGLQVGTHTLKLNLVLSAAPLIL